MDYVKILIIIQNSQIWQKISIFCKRLALLFADFYNKIFRPKNGLECLMMRKLSDNNIITIILMDYVEILIIIQNSQIW